MPLTHEFGMMEEVDSEKEYNEYEPEKYNCISVSDDSIELLMKDFMSLNIYWHSLNRPNLGIAYTGITLIPPESLPAFREILQAAKDNEQFAKLQMLTTQAIHKKKYLIHYGIEQKILQ